MNGVNGKKNYAVDRSSLVWIVSFLVLMGFLTLLLINLLRTSLIVLVVSRFPGSLWTFHIVIGQMMVTLKHKSLLGLIGVLASLVLYVFAVMLIETFHLSPHKGLLKLFVILLPFAVYACFFRFNKKEVQSEPKLTAGTSLVLK